MSKNFKTYQLAMQYYRHCEQLVLAAHLRDQLRRASSSIVLNIAEGNGKTSSIDRARFFATALGSLRECQAIREMARDEDPVVNSTADQLGACLYVLANKKAG